jgi:hypothetical protein
VVANAKQTRSRPHLAAAHVPRGDEGERVGAAEHHFGVAPARRLASRARQKNGQQSGLK